MRRLLVTVLVVAACVSTPPPPAKTPEPAPRPRVTKPKKPPPPAPETEEERARRIAAWESGIRAFFDDARVELRACYEDEVRRVEEEAILGSYKQGAKVPSLAGSVVVVVPIEADGAVREPRLEQDTLQNETVGRCLLDEASRWRLPPPPTGEPVELELPMKFELMGGEGG